MHESISIRSLARLVQEMMTTRRDYENSDMFSVRRYNYDKYFDLEKRMWAVTKEVLKPTGVDADADAAVPVPTPTPSVPPTPTSCDPAKAISIFYTNHRGVTSRRLIVPKSVRFAASSWHPEPQWLLDAWDVDKQDERSFAMVDILSWRLAGAATTQEQ